MPKLTRRERQAIQSLEFLLKDWPASLSVHVHGSSLRVFKNDPQGNLPTVERHIGGDLGYDTEVDEPDPQAEVAHLHAKNWDTSQT